MTANQHFTSRSLVRVINSRLRRDKNFMNFGVVVLCGGKSTRMGRDKASLPFGPESMLQRVVRHLRMVVDASRIVVVAADGQAVPVLQSEIQLVRDARSGNGPLEGLAAGMRAHLERSDAVFVTACDVPLLVPGFVTAMFELLRPEDSVVIPVDGNNQHSLNGVYRVSVLPVIDQLLSNGDFGVRKVFDLVPTRRVSVDTLRSVDPNLLSLENLNNPEDYRRAIAMAGLSISESLGKE